MDPRALRRMFLWLFLGCLGLTALLAIWAVLSAQFGDLQARVLMSSAAVSAASVCAMACAAFRERGRLPVLGTIGIGLAGVALLALLVLIWSEQPSTVQAKATFLLSIYAVGAAHAELLLLLPLARRHAAVQPAAVLAIGLLAVLLTALILAEPEGDALPRVLAVVAIVVALLTLAVPILWKIGGEARGGAAAGPRRLVLHEATDGTWVDDAGGRYALRRLDGEATNGG